MNMIAQVGGLVGSVLYGYIVGRTGSYDAPFVPMTILLILGAALWMNVDASRQIGGHPSERLEAVADSPRLSVIEAAPPRQSSPARPPTTSPG
jgi:hypothetical protein